MDLGLSVSTNKGMRTTRSRRSSAPGADEVPPGVRITARFGDIATLRVRRSEFPAIRMSEDVASMKAATRFYRKPCADRGAATPDSPAQAGDERRRQWEQATGRGVVVAVIDRRLDFAHPDLRRPDGRTRLLAL